MDIVLKQQSSPILFCPLAIVENKEDEFRSINFGELPNLSNAEYDTSSLYNSSHLRPLDLYNHKDGNFKCEYEFCSNRKVGTKIYVCKNEMCRFFLSGFHKECIEISKYPYHPKHSLRLIGYSLGVTAYYCLCCSSIIRSWLYICSICDFTICPDCARKPPTPLFEIDHPKRHEHTLFYFPRKGSLICDVCALNDHRTSLMFLCRQCDFVVHKECAYFPCIIRISRHEHRLAFISSLTPEKWLCGVCRGKIDTNYGRYACVKGCSYGVHSKCATRRAVWDGRELKGIPEDAYEDIKPFNEISDGIIQHFSHQNHHMRLDVETSREFDENKRCQACTHPICDDIIYNCMQCDFILHQKCANLPRKKYQPVHPHPLTLQVVDRNSSLSICDSCFLETNGFVYMCYERNCWYKVDVCCASITEQLDHPCHLHPLFLTSSFDGSYRCSICDDIYSKRLYCGECDFVLCFRCAALPSKLRYKHDKHILLFSCDEDVNSQYFCEVCEKEATPKNGIYTCNDCNVIVHIKCLLGEDIHLLPGRVIKKYIDDINILLNNHLTRKICSNCHNRCQGTIVFKVSDDKLFCSYRCITIYYTIKSGAQNWLLNLLTNT